MIGRLLWRWWERQTAYAMAWWPTEAEEAVQREVRRGQIALITEYWYTRRGDPQ